MREVLSTLLEIENEARNASYVAEDDDYTTQAEIKRRVTQIEREAKMRIAALTHEAANETNERIKEIERDYQQKNAAMESFFARAHDGLVDKIVNEVLHAH
ncbi:MAG: hypothetical protein FWC71_00200 [Defluviitaleaceae bacterium]|nr:hypothetical protein [Defluviitaleaceae bacterium]